MSQTLPIAMTIAIKFRQNCSGNNLSRSNLFMIKLRLKDPLVDMKGFESVRFLIFPSQQEMQVRGPRPQIEQNYWSTRGRSRCIEGRSCSSFASSG